MALHRCPECGHDFEGRANKITCSSTCKGRRDRREKPEVTVKKLYEAAHDGIMGLVGYSGDRDQLITMKAQKRLQVLCIEILQYAPEKVRADIYQQLKETAS